MTIRAGAYTRISLDWQGRGLGVQRQYEDCKEIARRHGWTIVSHYSDNSVGASKRSKSRGKRHDYQQLLDDIRAGHLDAVVIWMEDRLQREVIEMAEFLKVCDQAGLTRIASVGGEFDLSEPDQRNLLYIKAALAEAEIEKMAARMRRKNRESAEQGRQHLGGRRPFGDAWHGKQAVSEEQAAREREHIHEAARRIIAGDSLRGIVQDWHKRGIVSQFGTSWLNVNLRRMLLSPRLVAMREYDGKLYPGDWEPILDLETWQAVKAILEDPSRSTNLRAGLPRHLLSGMAHCGLCDNRLSVRRRRKNWIYYCATMHPGKGCGRIQRVADKLEELITEGIFSAVESDLYARLAGRSHDDPIGPLYELLARDRGLLDRLEDKVAQELIKPSTAKRNRAETERRMEQTRAEINRRRGNEIFGMVPRNLRQVWPDLSLDRQRAIVRAALIRVTVHPQPNAVVFDPAAIVPDWRR